METINKCDECNVEKLKRAIIKEELVELTGNYVSALVLDQFLYWTDRVNDWDDFIREENKRAEKYGEKTINESFRGGWIDKKAEELSTELMLGFMSDTISIYMFDLMNMDFLERRHNPIYKGEGAWQYRVNIPKVVSELEKLGYVLEGYSFIPYIKLCAARPEEYSMKGRKMV